MIWVDKISGNDLLDNKLYGLAEDLIEVNDWDLFDNMLLELTPVFYGDGSVESIKMLFTTGGPDLRAVYEPDSNIFTCYGVWAGAQAVVSFINIDLGGLLDSMADLYTADNFYA
jgi:hypothetical protein